MREGFLAACIGVLATESGPPAIAEEGSGVRSAVVFNIDAQPLASALDAYSAATGLQVVYDGTLAVGRRSKRVIGSMLPDLALRGLLDGTGLVAVYAGNAFTIVPVPAGPSRRVISLDDFMPYLAAIQGSVEQAFCLSPLTRPGGYRIKFRFWIGSNGEIFRPQLLGSTDDTARDQAIIRLLGQLTIGRPPPSNMQQPVVMAISPHAPAETGDCAFPPLVPLGRDAP